MIETTAITAMTPMTIPNNVSSDRRRFARSEESATEMASRKFMLPIGISHKMRKRAIVLWPARLAVGAVYDRPFLLNCRLRAVIDRPYSRLPSPAELFLKQSNLFFHGLLRRGRDSFDGLWCARCLLGFPIFASRLFRPLALSLGDRDRLWKAFR